MRSKQNCCVYTVLLGGYEELNEQEVAKSSSLDFVCITDDKSLESDTWQIRQINPILQSDIPRSSRFPKICAHKFLPDYDETLYIDNSVILKEKPEKIFHELLESQPYNMSCFVHPHRENIFQEINEVIRLGFDNSITCFEQAEHYLISGFAGRTPLIWAGLLLRRHNEPDVIECMEQWFYNVLRYSRRDQISFSFVAESLQFKFTAHDCNAYKSPYHDWPKKQNRNETEYINKNTNSIKPSILKNIGLNEELLRMNEELLRMNEELLRTRTEMSRQERAFNKTLKDHEDSVKSLHDQLFALNNSRSWKMTAPLRRISAWKQKWFETKGNDMTK